MARNRSLGSVYLRVRPDARRFRQDTQDEIGDRPITVDAEVRVDDSSVTKGLRDAQGRMDREKLDLTAEVKEEAFYRSLDRIARATQDLASEMEHLRVDVDDSSLRNVERKLNGITNRSRSIDFVFDDSSFESLTRAMDKVDQEIENLRNEHIKVNADYDDLDTLRQLLGELREESRLKFEYDANEAGLRQARNRVERAWQALQPKLEIDVSTDPESLRREMDRLDEEIERARKITVEVDDSSLDSVRRALARMREHAGETVRNNYEVSIADGSLQDLIEDLEETELDLVVELETGGAYRTFQQFKQDVESQDIELDLEASADTSSAIRSAFLMQRAAQAAAQPVPLGTRLNRASLFRTLTQMQALAGAARPTVDLHVRLRGGAMAALEGMLLAASQRRVQRTLERTVDRVWRNAIRGGFRSLAGLGDMDKLLETFDSVVSRLDVIGSNAAIMGTAIGSAVNVATHALGGLIVTLADAGRVAGLAAAAPTAILAGWAALHTHRSIWQDFSDALEGHEDALERLPPNARDAVDAINELSEAVNRSIQDGFWETMNDEITRFANTVAPILEQGMQRTAEIYGETLSAMLDRTIDWANSGALGAAFSNINRFFEGVGKGAVDFFDAFVTVGMQASHMFPRLGHWFSQLGDATNQWLQWASETGQIERWIHSGVNALQQMGRIAGATGGIFHGLTQAFRNAGIEGLPAMIRGLERARDVMQSPVFQVRMGRIFEGMAIGARDTWRGVERIAQALYESHEWARRLQITIGEVAREAGFRIGETIENDSFQQGTIDLFAGFRDMLQILEPGFQSLGNIIGALGTISGEILREMAPGINTLLGIFSDALQILMPSIINVIDPLTQFIDNLGHSVRANVQFIAPALGALLNGFAALPGPIQNFLTLAMAMSRWMPAFGTWFGNAARNIFGLRDAATRSYSSARRLINIFGTAGARQIVAMGNGFRDAGNHLRTFVGPAREGATRISALNSAVRAGAIGALAGLGAAARGAARGLGSLVALMGGIPGLLLIGSITALSVFRQRAAEAEQSVEDLGQAIHNADAQQFRSNILDEMGDSFDVILENGGSVRAMLDDLEQGGDIGVWQDRVAALSAYNSGLGDTEQWADAAAEAAEAFGISADFDDLSHAELVQLEHDMRGLAAHLLAGGNAAEFFASEIAEVDPEIATTGAGARQMAQDMLESGEAFHEASDGARRLAQSISDIGDTTVGADQQLSSLRQAMQTMGGDLYEPAEIAVEAWDHYANALRTAEAMTEATGEVVANEAGGISAAWEDMSERQRLAIQGTSELHDVAMARALQAYNDAIHGGESHAEAINLAKAAYGDLDSEIDAFIEKAEMSSTEAEAFRTQMEGLQSVSDLEIVLTMTNLSQQEIESAYDGLLKLHEAGAEIDAAEWMAFIAANPDQALLAVANTELALANFEASQFITSLDANQQGLIQALDEAYGKGELWESGDYAALLTFIEELDLTDAYATLQDWDAEKAEALLGADATQALIDLGILRTEVGEYEGEYTGKIDLEGGDAVVNALDGIRDVLVQIAEGAYGITIDDGDVWDGIDGMNLLKGDMEALDAMHVKPLMDLETGAMVIKADDASTRLDALESPREAAMRLGLEGFLGPEAQARALMQNFPDAEPNLDLNDRASGAARQAGMVIQNVKGKEVTINARSNADRVSGAARAAISRVTGKTVRINAYASGIGAIQSALARIPRNITTRVRTVGGGTTGGLGTVQRYMAGGFSENHQAMISQAGGPTRVWAEPETGGEAYIPLAASRRARSTAIWRETGRRLGAPEMQQGSTGGASTTYSPNVHVTVNHPQAEPTSRTVQRTLDYIGSGIRP